MQLNDCSVDFCVVANSVNGWAIWSFPDHCAVYLGDSYQISFNATDTFFVDNLQGAFGSGSTAAAVRRCGFRNTPLVGVPIGGPVTFSSCVFSDELPSGINCTDGGGNVVGQIVTTLALGCPTQSRTPIAVATAEETAKPTGTREPAKIREPTPSAGALPVAAVLGGIVAAAAVLGLAAAAAAICILKYGRGSGDSASGRSCVDVEVAHPTVPASAAPFSNCPTQENPLRSNDRRFDDSDCVHA